MLFIWSHHYSLIDLSIRGAFLSQFHFQLRLKLLLIAHPFAELCAIFRSYSIVIWLASTFFPKQPSLAHQANKRSESTSPRLSEGDTTFFACQVFCSLRQLPEGFIYPATCNYLYLLSQVCMEEMCMGYLVGLKNGNAQGWESIALKTFCSMSTLMSINAPA